MNICELKPGDRFHTKGDWQTEPGVWEVVEHEPDYGVTVCDPITHRHEGRSNFFSRGVTVEPVLA